MELGIGTQLVAEFSSAERSNIHDLERHPGKRLEPGRRLGSLPNRDRPVACRRFIFGRRLDPGTMNNNSGDVLSQTPPQTPPEVKEFCEQVRWLSKLAKRTPQDLSTKAKRLFGASGPIVQWTNWLQKNGFNHETKVREALAGLSKIIGRLCQELPPENEPYADSLSGWADDLEPLLLEIVGLSERSNGPELIERLLAGPEDVKLTGEQLAFLEAHLKKAVNFAVVQQERKSNRNQESATWNRRKKLKLIRDYNRELLKLRQPERATAESGGGAESSKNPAGKGKRIGRPEAKPTPQEKKILGVYNAGNPPREVARTLGLDIAVVRAAIDRSRKRGLTRRTRKK